jgi:hypothetical protein
MRGHFLQVVEWVASVQGTGFVATCECGWQTGFERTREGAIGLSQSHALLEDAPPKPRWWRAARVRPQVTAPA